MKNYNTILTKKEQKISTFSSRKIDKYECLTGEEILTFDQSRIIEQAKFSYSPFRKAFEKQIKTTEDQGIKQVETLKGLKMGENQELESVGGLFPKKMRKYDIENELDRIKKCEEKNKIKDLKYETKNTYMIFSNMKQ